MGPHSSVSIQVLTPRKLALAKAARVRNSWGFEASFCPAHETWLETVGYFIPRVVKGSAKVVCALQQKIIALIPLWLPILGYKAFTRTVTPTPEPASRLASVKATAAGLLNTTNVKGKAAGGFAALAGAYGLYKC